MATLLTTGRNIDHLIEDGVLAADVRLSRSAAERLLPQIDPIDPFKTLQQFAEFSRAQGSQSLILAKEALKSGNREALEQNLGRLVNVLKDGFLAKEFSTSLSEIRLMGKGIWQEGGKTRINRALYRNPITLPISLEMRTREAESERPDGMVFAETMLRKLQIARSH